MAGHFTEEQIRLAKEVSLTALAAHYGYSPVRVGRLYTLKEHDSVRIYDDRSWCRWSKLGNKSEAGGSQIDFLMNFCGFSSFSEAVTALLQFQGIHAKGQPLPLGSVQHQAKQIKEKEHKEFILPEPVDGNYRRLYAYLIQTRGLSQGVIDYFVRDLKILYEDKNHHNMVFLGKDKEGRIRYATKRGTMDIYGKKYRGDVAGNDKNYGINIVNPASSELKVFEANIDLMSYLDITGDYQSNKLVLGMVADNPLVQFLRDNPHVKKIGFCLDNDEAGKRAVYGDRGQQPAENGRQRKIGLLQKYAQQGYETYAQMVPENIGCKDWNEYLIYQKECQAHALRQPSDAGDSVRVNRGRAR